MSLVQNSHSTLSPNLRSKSPPHRSKPTAVSPNAIRKSNSHLHCPLHQAVSPLRSATQQALNSQLPLTTTKPSQPELKFLSTASSSEIGASTFFLCNLRRRKQAGDQPSSFQYVSTTNSAVSPPPAKIFKRETQSVTHSNLTQKLRSV